MSAHWRDVKDPGRISRRARTQQCLHCHQPIKAGLDDDVCAFLALVDPTPLDAHGELTAILQGRRTYEIRWHRDHYEIDYRPSHRIRSRPPHTVRGTVHADHRCGQPLPIGKIPDPHPLPDPGDDTPPF